MVGKPADIHVEAFSFDYEPGENVDHLAEHGVTPADVADVHDGPHLFFFNLEDDEQTHRGTHVMVGRDSKARSLFIVIVETTTPGVWLPVTGRRSGVAHRLLQRGGFL